MEKKVNKIYEEAYSDVSEKWNKFMNSHYPKLDRAIQDLREAEKSGDAAAIKEAKDVYERTAKNIVVNNRRFNAMAEETAAKISHTNEIALAYVNDQLPGIYSLNYNAFGEEKIKGYSFSLVNESAVKELAKSDKTLLPKKKLDIPKDMQWNKKLINSQMLQGILQGENIPTMAKRLMNVTDMNRVSAIRNARTMTTAAENKGRQDSFKKATEDGVIMKRIWVATTDDRTRAWHADLDGVAVDVDEPWENEYGQIMYPGDPSADPANVYNCRCSIRTHIEGFRWNEELEEQVEEEFKENIVAGVDINTPQYDAFSEDFQELIPQLANDIENSDLPDFNTLFDLYRKAETPEDKELVEFVGNLHSNVQTYKNESKEDQKYHAEIFSVLSKPHDGALYRGESGEWVKHYGDFTIGKEISFEHLSFTTPNLSGTPSHHSGVIFEFASGTKSINFVGQDDVENDELILGNFIIKSVEDFNGVPKVLLGSGGDK